MSDSKEGLSLDRNKILFLYDLFTLLTLEKSWEIKRKSKLSIEDYKRARKAVRLDTFVSRIKKAA